MKKRVLVFIPLLVVLFFTLAGAAETVRIVYQNDLHGWLYPSLLRPGMEEVKERLVDLFQSEPNSFYAMSGDLLTGPDLPEHLKGKAELEMWNAFWGSFASRGWGERVLISAGNHEFDYGLLPAEEFRSGLLCANLVTREGGPFYVSHKVLRTRRGLRIGVVGLLMDRNARVERAAERGGLRLISGIEALRRVIPKLESPDLTVLMIHDHLSNIADLAQQLTPEMGVDLILSGHDHLILNEPFWASGVPVLQAGAMNLFLGEAELLVEKGRIKTFKKNRVVSRQSSPLHYALLKVKETVDGRRGNFVALLKGPLLGACQRGHESSLGDFVTDTFRWATGSDIAMTNSGSLRMSYPLPKGRTLALYEGDVRSMVPFNDRLVRGRVRGKDILRILEGEARQFRNQVSGLSYTLDRREGRVTGVKVGGHTLREEAIYTLTHNSYCTAPGRIHTCLHLDPGTVAWEPTGFTVQEAVIAYGRHLGIIEYPAGGEGRIRVLP